MLEAAAADDVVPNVAGEGGEEGLPNCENARGEAVEDPTICEEDLNGGPT
jgi:hypothetical protein